MLQKALMALGAVTAGVIIWKFYYERKQRALWDSEAEARQLSEAERIARLNEARLARSGQVAGLRGWYR